MNLIKKLVIKNLILNKRRTIVSIIGIILAVALLTALSTLTGSFRTSIIEREKDQEGNYHVMFRNVPSEDVEGIKQNRNVKNTYTEIALGYAYLEGSVNPDKPYAYVTSFDKTALSEAPIALYEGRMPENSSEIIISRHVNTNGRVGLKIGDTITLNIGTRESLDDDGEVIECTQTYAYNTWGEEAVVDTTEHTYTIVGIINRPGYTMEPYHAPGYTFVTLSDSGNAQEVIDKLYVEYTNEALLNVSEVTATILGIDEYKDLFAAFNNLDSAASYEDITEEDWEFYMSEVMPKVKYNWDFNTWLIRYQRVWPIDSMFITLFILAGFVGLVIIGTSIYCIKNSFEISVTEKIHLYGMLAGIGATRKQIKRSVLFEAAFEGVIGLPLGIGLGLLASYILSKISNVLLAESFYGYNLLKLDISWIAIAVTLVLGIITIYFSSISATIKAGRITPIEAIRNSTDIKLNARKIKAPIYISKIWGVGGTIAYKNIKRNKRKYRTSVVSIAICTVTFIVVSYFMSLLMSVTGNVYINEPCNLSVTVYNPMMNYEEIHKYFAEFDNQNQVEYAAANYVGLENAKYTKDMQKLAKATDEELEEFNNSEILINLWVLDDNSFSTYLKKIGKTVKDGEAVFYNYIAIQSVGIARAFDYDGDSISVYKEDYDSIEYTDDGEIIEDSVVYYRMDIPVGVEVDEVPLGFGYQSSAASIIMSNTTFDMLGIEEKIGISRAVSDIFYETDGADKLQDSLDKMLDENASAFRDGCYVYNRDQNAQEENSFYTLIAIFAYGLIIVIALIGITNIINTLGTSMELRARDFATLRSIGMTKGQFRRMVWLESVFTSAKSLIIGIVIGLAITLAFWKYEYEFDEKFAYNPPIAAILICVAVVIILVYLIISTSLNKINKRNIVETIKNENI